MTDVQHALRGASYPIDGDQLAELAQRNGAESELVDGRVGYRVGEQQVHGGDLYDVVMRKEGRDTASST